MTLPKGPMVKVAALEGFVAHQTKRFLARPNAGTFAAVFFAVVVSATIIAGLYHVSGQGSLDVLKQRVMGTVELSTGTHAARTVGDLNQLSWENGLEILTTLDTMNTTMDSLETISLKSRPSQQELARQHGGLKSSVSKMDRLLRDRKALMKTARLLGTSQLYTPVYQEYLTTTKLRLSHVATLDQPKARLVQK